MIQIDSVLLEAFRSSHTRTCVLSVYEGTTMVADNILISEGSVKADRNQQARRSLSCTVPLSQWQDVPGLSVIKSRLQVWSGYDLGGATVMVPLGVFRVDELSRGNEGALEVSGVSLEGYVIDDIFVDELIIPKGQQVLQTIQDLILDTLPDATFDISAFAQSEAAVTLLYDLPAKRDRWEAVGALAAIIGCDVYCGPDGKFRIYQKPSMINMQPVWRINEGPDGVLVEMKTKVGRANTYNAVLAMNQSSDSENAPYSAVVYDDDPLSPTQWGGPFGKKLFVYQDDYLTSKALCQAKAEELLAAYKAEDRYLDFSAVPNPAIEPDDVVEVTMLDGTIENHLITSVDIPIGLGAWSAQTLSNKAFGELRKRYTTANEVMNVI